MIRGLGAMLLAAGGFAGLLLAAAPSATANVIGVDLGVDFMKVRRRLLSQRCMHFLQRMEWNPVSRRVFVLCCVLYGMYGNTYTKYSSTRIVTSWKKCII